MYKPSRAQEMVFISLFLEGFLYGLYSGIIAIYIQYHSSKSDTNKTQNILFYSMCALYVSSAAVFASDIAFCIYIHSAPINWGHPTIMIQSTVFACCDFIAQFILIYRCWIVWGRNIRIVIIPSIFAFAFLVIWAVGGRSALEGPVTYARWRPNSMTPVALALSFAVNTLVMGLIVFRIFAVFREVKAASDHRILSTTGGGKLRRIILVLVESAVALFSIQLIRLVVSILETGTAQELFSIIAGIHQMFNGITPTIILLRTSMGLSFHDEKSMEEFAIGSFHCAPNHPNSVPESGSIGTVGQGSRNDDNNNVQRSHDLDVVEI